MSLETSFEKQKANGKQQKEKGKTIKGKAIQPSLKPVRIMAKAYIFLSSRRDLGCV